MYHYIDVNVIIGSIPIENQADVTIEFPVYSSKEDEVKQASYTKVKSSTAVYNIPDTNYISFNGITTNIGVSTKDGVLHHNSFGFLYIDVHNSSLQVHTIPYGMKLGSISIKRYIDLTNFCDLNSQQCRL